MKNDKDTVPDMDTGQRELIASVDRLLAPNPKERGLQKEIVLTKLYHKLPDLLFRWSPHPSQSDFECAFCGQRPESHHHDIVHDGDCLGVELLKVLG